jgi:hypothetical protein
MPSKRTKRRQARLPHSKSTVIGVRVKRAAYERVCAEASKDSRTIGAEAGVLMEEALDARHKRGGR